MEKQMQEQKAQQELAFIKKVMEDSKNILVEDGKGFIFWGVLITVGLVYSYFAVISGGQKTLRWFWLALIAFGWLYTIIVETRQAKKRRISTFAGKIMGAIWISCGISMTLFGFIGPLAGAYSTIYINAALSFVLAIGYFVTGVVYRVKWITLLSIGWWAGGIVIFFWRDLSTLLVMAGMMIFFQLIPGILLYKKYKKDSAAVSDERV